MVGTAQARLCPPYNALAMLARNCPVGQISRLSLIDCPAIVQPLLKKYFCFTETKIDLYLFPSRPTKGRLAIVTKRGAGCDGR
jgi:hypothetical protein